MTALMTVYWLCFAVGLIYVVAVGALGAIGHAGGAHTGDVHGDAGSADVHTDIASSGVHGETGSVESAGMESSDLSTDATDGELTADMGGLESGGLDGHGLEATPGLHGTHTGVHIGHAHEHNETGAMEYNPFSPLSLMGFACAFGAAGLISSAAGMNTLASLGCAVAGGLAMALLMWFCIGKLMFSMQGSSEAHQADMVGLEADVLTPIGEGHMGEIAYVLEGVRYTAPAKLLHEGTAAKTDKVRIRRVEGNFVYVEQKRKLLE